MITVLFVCVRNAGRSQMAEALLNAKAKGRARAMSAGTLPSDAVNPLVVEAMRQAGIDISRKKPRKLTPDLQAKADRLINIGCLDSIDFPSGMTYTDDWRVPDTEGRTLAEIIKIRNEINRRVLELLVQL